MESTKCVLLKTVGKSIADPQMKIYLTTMKREQCIEDECEYYSDCWKKVQEMEAKAESEV